jgi:hypothetical protein
VIASACRAKACDGPGHYLDPVPHQDLRLVFRQVMTTIKRDQGNIRGIAPEKQRLPETVLAGSDNPDGLIRDLETHRKRGNSE